jgi:hypothetical protein
MLQTHTHTNTNTNTHTHTQTQHTHTHTNTLSQDTGQTFHPKGPPAFDIYENRS